MSIIIAILGFGLLVLVHEFGHFLLARANGVKVEEFSIGLGPTLLSKKGKQGTIWSIKALPIGGMCQMKGEDMEETSEQGSTQEPAPEAKISNLVDGQDSFQDKNPWQRISIIFAGPFFNLILGLIFFTILAQSLGFQTNKVKVVQPDTPAQAVGLQPNDEIRSVNGLKTTTFQDVVTYLAMSQGKATKLEVARGNQVLPLEITPKKLPSGQYVIGFEPTMESNPNPIQAIGQGFKESVSMVRQTYLSLKMLVTGRVGMDQVGGPLAIIGMASDIAQNSLLVFLRFLGLLSINLAIFNLLPFPALDGGWLLMLLAEVVRGKKIPDRFMTVWNTVGFALLMLFMLLVTLKDILRPIKF